MELNKNSLTAKLVKYSYPFDGLSNNLCSFFWQAFFAYLFLPFIAIHYFFESLYLNFNFKLVLDKNDKPFLLKIFYGLIIYIEIVFFIGISFITGLIIIDSNILFLNFAFGFTALICSYFILKKIITILIKIISFFFSYFNRIEKKEKKKNIISEYIKAKKQKICPIINWK